MSTKIFEDFSSLKNKSPVLAEEAQDSCTNYGLRCLQEPQKYPHGLGRTCPQSKSEGYLLASVFIDTDILHI
jgi:hypothetical protein